MSSSPPRRRRGLLPFLAVCLAVFALVAGYLRFFGGAEPPTGITLTDLRGVDDLKARFNADSGQTRLVVIFAPT
jgi:hypothetical protein